MPVERNQPNTKSNNNGTNKDENTLTRREFLNKVGKGAENTFLVGGLVWLGAQLHGIHSKWGVIKDLKNTYGGPENPKYVAMPLNYSYESFSKYENIREDSKYNDLKKIEELYYKHKNYIDVVTDSDSIGSQLNTASEILQKLYPEKNIKKDYENYVKDVSAIIQELVKQTGILLSICDDIDISNSNLDNDYLKNVGKNIENVVRENVKNNEVGILEVTNHSFLQDALNIFVEKYGEKVILNPNKNCLKSVLNLIEAIDKKAIQLKIFDKEAIDSSVSLMSGKILKDKFCEKINKKNLADLSDNEKEELRKYFNLCYKSQMRWYEGEVHKYYQKMMGITKENFFSSAKKEAFGILKTIYGKEFYNEFEIVYANEKESKRLSDHGALAQNRAYEGRILISDFGSYIETVLSIVHELAHNAVSHDFGFKKDIHLEESYTQGIELIASRILKDKLCREVDNPEVKKYSKLNDTEKKELKEYFDFCDKNLMNKYWKMIVEYYQGREVEDYSNPTIVKRLNNYFFGKKNARTEEHCLGMAILDSLAGYIQNQNGGQNPNAFVEAINWIQTDKPLPPEVITHMDEMTKYYQEKNN